MKQTSLKCYSERTSYSLLITITVKEKSLFGEEWIGWLTGWLASSNKSVLCVCLPIILPSSRFFHSLALSVFTSCLIICISLMTRSHWSFWVHHVCLTVCVFNTESKTLLTVPLLSVSAIDIRFASDFLKQSQLYDCSYPLFSVQLLSSFVSIDKKHFHYPNIQSSNHIKQVDE